MRMARELYGSKSNQLAWIIGPGPSIRRAEKNLMEPHPHSFRIAINKAITKIPCEYWLFIDELAYRLYRDHPNAKAAIKLGVENNARFYEDDVYLWEPAKKLPDDVQNLKLLHRGTSLVAAIGMAALLGSPRIVTVGCDHTFDDDYMKEKQVEVNAHLGRNDDFAKIKNYYLCTKIRINKALTEVPFWLPRWVTVRDASGGELPIPPTWIGAEFKMLDRFYKRLEEKLAKESVA